MKLTKFKDVKIGNTVMGYDSDGILVIGMVAIKFNNILTIGQSLAVERDKDLGIVSTSMVIYKKNKIHSDEFIYVMKPEEIPKIL